MGTEKKLLFAFICLMCHMPALINVEDFPSAATYYLCAFIKLSYS